MDDLLAHTAEVGAQLDEHLGGNALALADQPEQDVLGTDVVVAELQRFTQRQLENLLRAWREGNVAGRRGATLTDDFFDLAADGFERDSEGFHGFGGDAFAFVDETQENVLCADVAVIEQSCFFLRKNDDPPGPISKAFEHARPFPRRWIREASVTVTAGRVAARGGDLIWSGPSRIGAVRCAREGWNA